MAQSLIQTDCNSIQFFALSPAEIGLLLELLDARVGEISLTHSPNMNAAAEDDKGTKRVLSVSRTTGADGLPGVIFKFAGEFQAAAALSAGEARTLRVRTRRAGCFNSPAHWRLTDAP